MFQVTEFSPLNHKCNQQLIPYVFSRTPPPITSLSTGIRHG
jgi:hypothetical protein